MHSEFIYDTAPFPSCHASTIVEPEPGKLVAAWFGGTREGNRDVQIWLARHDGMRWSAPEMVARDADWPCWNPVLFKLPVKPPAPGLALYYKAGKSPSTWAGFVKRSADGGKTWSPAERLPDGILGPIKNKPILRPDGTILSGSSVETSTEWTCYVERSTDAGQTWQRSGPIAVPGHPYGIIQPTLFGAKDGRIIFLCRSRGLGVICKSESRDGGVSWSPAEKTELPHPGSGIDLVKTAEGPIFLVYNHTKIGRSPLNLGYSADDGKTWKMVATLEDQPGEYSYPAIIQTQDGRLHITYTHKRTRIKHVVLDPMQFRNG